MDARDKRFLCGVLRQSVPFSTSPLGEFPHAQTQWRLAWACEQTPGADAACARTASRPASPTPGQAMRWC